jgi:hypothetical protein
MVMTLSRRLLHFAGLALFTWVSIFGEGGGIHGMNINLPVFLYEASLDIRVHPGGAALQPPAELLLKSPDGRKTGVDPITRNRLSEIPQSSIAKEGIDDDVSGAPGPRSLVLYVRKPVTGFYSLQVIGVRSGSYTLEIQASDVELETSRKTFLDREISEGEIHLYLIEFDERAGEELAVTYSGSSRIQH